MHHNLGNDDNKNNKKPSITNMKDVDWAKMTQ